MDKLRVTKLEELIKVVETICELESGSIKSDSRKRELAYPRHCIYYLGCKKLSYTTVRMGELLDRDHATIIYGRDRLKDVIKNPRNNKPLHNVYNRIMDRLWVTDKFIPTQKIALSIFDISRITLDYDKLEGTHIQRLKAIRDKYTVI